MFRPSLVALLAVLAAPAFAAPAITEVRVTDKGCDPAALDVEAGKTTFRIRNDSARAMEFEILKGVEVVEERENILPAFVQTLTAELQPGEYAMTCGLLSNPQGIVKVAANSAAAPLGKPSPMDLVGPIAQYKVYVTKEVDTLVALTTKLVAAAKAGNLAEAQAAYAPAHLHYERIEPIAELFNDLDGSMDSREDDFEKKAEDPKFLGFHRLEKALFADKTTQGVGPVADRLLADAQTLKARLADLVITPKAMVGGAAELIEEVASKKIAGEEDRYSHTDLWDFDANLDGAKEITKLLGPLVRARDPKLDSRVSANFNAVDARLKPYRKGDAFANYEALTEADRTALKGPIAKLAEDLSTYKGVLGVE